MSDGREPSPPEGSRRSVARSAGFSLCVALLATLGCRTVDGTFGVPPFYEVYETPGTFGAGEGNETYYRPLLSFESATPGGRRIRSVLPFLDFRWGPDHERYWILPTFLYSSFPQPLAGQDVDWMLFPLLFGGHDPVEGSYFAVLPFGGTLKGLLGQDEIEFAMFPIYWRSRDRARQSLHVLWPFYNRVWGGDWSGGRLWPFYGHYSSYDPTGRLRNDRWFAGWPFYIRRNDNLTTLPTELFFTFPFYGYRVNSRTETFTYLWPLFQTAYDRRYDRRSYEGYIFPYRIAPGQTDIWPFFGIKKVSRGTEVKGVVRRTYRHYFLWPLERYEWGSDGKEESTRFWLLPLFWHFYYIDKSTLETRTESKIWPLFDYRRSDEVVSFDLLSPLWFRREEYDRYYSRWFGIFRYRWRPQVGGWELLYGAAMYRRLEAEAERSFSILGGLLELGTRHGGLYGRLLYVPWW